MLKQAKGIGQPVAEHDDDSVPATPADTGNIAQVPASHESSRSLGTSASAGASIAFIAAESQEDISDLPLADPRPETSDNSEGASSAMSKQGRSVQIQASGTAGDRLEAEASASTDHRSSRSLSPARPSTPQPSPSSRRQEQHAAPTLPESRLGPAQAAQAHQAPPEAALEQEGSWEKVRRSRRRQPPQQASGNGVGPRKAPMPGKALPEQAAAAEPPQAHRLPVPWGTQNGLPVPKLQQAAMQPSSACPDAGEDDDECVVCLDNAREVLFLTCGHMVRLLLACCPHPAHRLSHGCAPGHGWISGMYGMKLVMHDVERRSTGSCLSSQASVQRELQFHICAWERLVSTFLEKGSLSATATDHLRLPYR